MENLPRINFPKIKILNKILIANLIAFFDYILLQKIFGYMGEAKLLSDILLLKSDVIMTLITPWTLITYSFLHASFWHFFGNMIMLFFIGLMFCQIFGEKKLLPFYLTSAVFVAIFNIFVMNLIGVSEEMIAAGYNYSYALGASGVVFGLLVAVGIMAPNMTVNLFFFIPVKLKWIVIGLLVLEAVSLDGSAIGHLSGALFGLLFAMTYKKGINITALSERMIYRKPIDIDQFDNPMLAFDSGGGCRSGNCGGGDNTTTKWKTSPKVKEEKSLCVDDILDKINEKGMKSLTKEELTFLKRKGK